MLIIYLKNKTMILIRYKRHLNQKVTTDKDSLLDNTQRIKFRYELEKKNNI